MTEEYKATRRHDRRTYIVARCASGGWDVRVTADEILYFESASDVVDLFYKQYQHWDWTPEVPRGHEFDLEYHQRGLNSTMPGNLKLLMNLDGYYNFKHGPGNRPTCHFYQHQCRMRTFEADEVILYTDIRTIVVSFTFLDHGEELRFEDRHLLLDNGVKEAVRQYLPTGVSNLVFAYASQFVFTWGTFIKMLGRLAPTELLLNPVKDYRRPIAGQHGDRIVFHV